MDNISYCDQIVVRAKKNFFIIRCVWLYLVGSGKVRCLDQKFPEQGHSYLDSDRHFGHVEASVRKMQNICLYSVDEYMTLMTAHSKSQLQLLITKMFDKWLEIKILPCELSLCSNAKSAEENVHFRKKVKWVRVDTFGVYKYNKSHDDAEDCKIVDIETESTVTLKHMLILNSKAPSKLQIKEKIVRHIQKQLPYMAATLKGFYLWLHPIVVSARRIGPSLVTTTKVQWRMK